MEGFFSSLKVGDKVDGRETRGYPWKTLTVMNIDLDNITFEDADGGEVDSDRDEVNEGVFFKAALK
jgi:hypothetical protein